MNKIRTGFFLFVLSLTLLGCGNPTVEELAQSSGVGGNTPITPKPPGGGDGGGGGDDDTPEPPRLIIEVNGYAIEKDELGELKLPYKKGIVKPVPMGTTVKAKECPKNHKHHCVKNRQVLAAFDLGDVSKHLDDYDISDIQLRGDFYSIGKNYRTELLCLLHKKACSGRAIVKIPGWGMPWIVKMAWWKKSFWKAGRKSVVKTKNFYNELEASWNEDEGLYMLEGASLKFNRLFKYNKDDLTSMTKGQKRFVIVVTDDTYFQNVKLIFKLVEKK